MDYKKKISVVVPLGYNREILVEKSLKKNKVSFFVEQGQNPSANRNRGLEKAKTPLIGFVNAHTILTNNWAKEVVEFFLKYPDVDIVGGPQLTKEDENLFAKASGYALSSAFGTANLRDRYRSSKVNLHATEKEITLANLICKREVLKNLRFDEKLYPGEDVRFIHKAENSGFRIAYSPDIIVYNTRRKQVGGFYGLIKQIFNYGRVRPRLEGLNKIAKKPLFLIPTLFLSYLLFLPLLTTINTLFLLPLLAYIILDIFFSFYESIKNNNLKAFCLLPFIFPTIHITYGIGFLYGFITNTTALVGKR